MIHSLTLDNFFKQYDYNWLYSFLRSVFGVTYVKTYSNCGCYVWFGGNRKEFDNNLQIDKDSPMCYIKTGLNHIDPITLKNVEDSNIFIFLNCTEKQVIKKFTKSLKMKVFL